MNTCNYFKQESVIFFVWMLITVTACHSNTGNKSSEKEAQDTVLEKTATKNPFQNTQTTVAIEENLSGELIVLTEEEFIAKITEINNPKGFQYKGTIPCVVDFYADWCRPCHILTPILTELAKEYQSKIIFYKVNVEKALQVSQKLNIESIPNLFLFKVGSQPVSIVGVLPKEELKRAIENVLLSESQTIVSQNNSH
jgi:thioredoxin